MVGVAINPDDFPEPPKPETLVEIRLEEQFARWVSLGDRRSFKAISDLVNIPVATVTKHAQKFRWRARMSAIQAKASQRTLERLVETQAEVNEQHLGELRELRGRAMKKLKDSPLLHDRDAIKLYLETIKLEREILGGSDERDLADLLFEKMKQVQARDITPQVEGGHEFELDEDLDQEPLMLPEPEELEGEELQEPEGNDGA